MSEQSKESTRYRQNLPFCNCCVTQLTWLERRYLTSQSNDMDVLGVRILCIWNQANSYKQQNRHMKIFKTWFAGKGIQYDPSSYCGCFITVFVSKASVSGRLTRQT